MGTDHASANIYPPQYVLDQARFGIKPFTALLGTLKVAREVRIEVSLSTERLG